MCAMKSRVVYSPEEITFLKEQFSTNKKIAEIRKEHGKLFSVNRTETALSALRYQFARKARAAAQDGAQPAMETNDNNVAVTVPANPDAGKKKRINKVVLDVPPTVAIPTIRTGALLYHPECGVMRSQGVSKTEIGGYSFEVLSLLEVHAKSAQINTAGLRILLPRTQIAAKNVRGLYDAETLDKALAYLKTSETMGAIPGNTTGRKQDYLQRLEMSGSLKDTCELLVRVYKAEGSLVGRGFAERGMKALHKLTGEYASVHKMDYAVAESVIKQAMSFKIAHQLDRETSAFTL